MANEPISQLTQTTSPSATDCVPIVSQGITQKVAINTLVQSASANIMGDPFFYASGQWLYSKGPFNASNPITNGQLTVYPQIFGYPVSINAISVSLSSGAIASGMIYMGIYNATPNGNMPGTLIAASSVSTPGSSAGFHTVTYNTPVALSAGVYWLGMAYIGGNPLFLQLTYCNMWTLPYSSPVVGNAVIAYTMSTSGALPSSFIINNYSSLAPRIFLQLV